MRVALLYPEVYDMARFKENRKEFPPFGVLYLAAVMEQAGHNVTVKKVTPQATYLELSHYDAVGFSLASSATYGFMREARDRSAIHKDALVMEHYSKPHVIEKKNNPRAASYASR